MVSQFDCPGTCSSCFKLIICFHFNCLSFVMIILEPLAIMINVYMCVYSPWYMYMVFHSHEH